MKHYQTIILSLALLLLPTLLPAQSCLFDEHLSLRKDEVIFSMTVRSDHSLSTLYKEIIRPYLCHEQDTLYLDPIEVFGKGRYLREKQEKYLQGDKNWDLGLRQILDGKSLAYLVKVPVQPWMSSVQVGVKHILTGCQCSESQQDTILIQQQSLFAVPVVAAPAPVAPLVYALTDAKGSWDFQQDELEVVFQRSKAVMDSTIFNNQITFQKILQAVDRIYANPAYKLDKIEVAGYASPEGRPEFNSWLGENRAKALIDYIIAQRPQYKLTRQHFRIRNGEENWEGLRRLVAASKMKYRQEVLDIIDNDTIPDERRKLWIEKLDYGWVWNHMLKEIYPQLRCARYLAVYYDTVDETVIDQINQGNALIRQGDYEKAYQHLLSVQQDMRSHNSIGVALMMMGRYEEAKVWFQEALLGNSPDAQKNIETINKLNNY